MSQEPEVLSGWVAVLPPNRGMWKRKSLRVLLPMVKVSPDERRPVGT